MFHCIVLYCIVLYCIVLYCIVLGYIIRFPSSSNISSILTTSYIITPALFQSGGVDVDAPDPISPKYSLQWKSPISFDMNKQSGREQLISGIKREENEANTVNQEIYGFEDADIAMKLAREKDDAVERGRAATSGVRLVKTLVNMEKQEQGRDEASCDLDNKHALELDLSKYESGGFVLINSSFCFFLFICYCTTIVFLLIFPFNSFPPPLFFAIFFASSLYVFHSSLRFLLFSFPFNSLQHVLSHLFFSFENNYRPLLHVASTQIITKISLIEICHHSGFGKNSKGIEDWKKQMGRGNNPEGRTLDPVLESQELILEPDEAVTSKYDFAT